MKHSIIQEGHAFRLRPICDDDAELVVQLRSNPELNRYLHASSDRVEDQLAWFESYYTRTGDYYFVVEQCQTRQSEGVISIYDVDATRRTGEWGRWILRPGSLAAVESAWLIYRVAFEQLGLKKVYCRTIADNQKVVSFHDSCGISQRRRLRNFAEIRGQKMDVIEHEIDAASWKEIGPRLETVARLTVRRLARA